MEVGMFFWTTLVALKHQLDDGCMTKQDDEILSTNSGINRNKRPKLGDKRAHSDLMESSFNDEVAA